jgi:hypothetical protein
MAQDQKLEIPEESLRERPNVIVYNRQQKEPSGHSGRKDRLLASPVQARLSLGVPSSLRLLSASLWLLRTSTCIRLLCTVPLLRLRALLVECLRVIPEGKRRARLRPFQSFGCLAIVEGLDVSDSRMNNVRPRTMLRQASNFWP